MARLRGQLAKQPRELGRRRRIDGPRAVLDHERRADQLRRQLRGRRLAQAEAARDQEGADQVLRQAQPVVAVQIRQRPYLQQHVHRQARSIEAGARLVEGRHVARLRGQVGEERREFGYLWRVQRPVRHILLATPLCAH